MTQNKNGTLYVVATPIGNLDDLSARAINVLKSVDLICAEDTRHTQSLLNYIHADVPTLSLHEHNEASRIEELKNRLDRGNNIALVSDAGTPAISDPGFVVIRALKEAGFTISPIPGACAVIAALCASGLATDSFIFDGFLPAKTHARKQAFSQYEQESRTVVLYESSHRIIASLQDLVEVLGPERKVSIAREITKLFETIVTDTAQNLLSFVLADKNQSKGEFVVMIEGVKNHEKTDDEILNILSPLMQELPLKQASRLTAQISGCKSKYAYQLGLGLKNEST